MSPLGRFALATAIALGSLPVPAQMAPPLTRGASGLLCSEPEFSRLNTSKLELYMHRLARIAIVATIAACFSAAASAATTPADAIKYRRAVMDGLSAHVSAFVLINFGKVEHQDHLKAHANALADLGAQAKVLFPAGSDNGETEALPLIWEAKEQEQFNPCHSWLYSLDRVWKTRSPHHARNDDPSISLSYMMVVMITCRNSA